MFDNYTQKNKRNSSDINGSDKKNINLLPDSQSSKPFKSRSQIKAKLSKDQPMHVPPADSMKSKAQSVSWLVKVKQLFTRGRSMNFKKSDLQSQKISPYGKQSHLIATQAQTPKVEKAVIGSRSVKEKSGKNKQAAKPRFISTNPTIQQHLNNGSTAHDKEPLSLPQLRFHKIKDEQLSDNPSDLEVNLLPVQKRHFTQNQILITYFVIIAILSLLTIMPYINYFTQNKNIISQIKVLQSQVKLSQAKNQDVSQQASQLKPFWLKLQVLKDLLENHIYWHEFFKLLETHTAANVYFTHLNVSASDNSVELSGKALRLRDVAEQLIIFQNNPAFHETALVNLSFLEQESEQDPGFEFSIKFKLGPQLIKKSKATDLQSASTPKTKQ